MISSLDKQRTSEARSPNLYEKSKTVAYPGTTFGPQNFDPFIIPHFYCQRSPPLRLPLPSHHGFDGAEICYFTVILVLQPVNGDLAPRYYYDYYYIPTGGGHHDHWVGGGVGGAHGPVPYIYIQPGPFTVTVSTTEVTKISTRKKASELLGSKWTTLLEKGLESQKEHRIQNHVISNIIYSIHITWDIVKATERFVNRSIKPWHANPPYLFNLGCPSILGLVENFLVGGFSPTHLKNAIVKMGPIFPKVRGEHKIYRKHLSCQHLVYLAPPKSGPIKRPGKSRNPVVPENPPVGR